MQSAPSAAVSRDTAPDAVLLELARRAPRFDEHTLEVTEDVLARFLAGLQAEGAERQRLAADRTRAAEFRASVERFERCEQREEEAREDRSEAISAQSEEVAMRIAQAMMRGDTATSRRLTDSLMVAARGGPSTCGARPTAEYESLRRLDRAGEQIAGASADAGRFTVRQFAILRERIAPWVLSGGTQGSFTAEERRALEARRDELARHGELLRA